MSQPIAEATPAVEELAALLRNRRTVVLTGAGCSTESGIPDYRGPQGTLRRRAPMQYREFMGHEAARRRYWARSVIGWTRVAAARPNAAHLALARLESAGVVQGVITQNVDGLHTAAGSRRVVELHGSLDRVRCMECGEQLSRADFQDRLRTLNPDWLSDDATGSAASAPDGDAEIGDAEYADFHVPDCDGCQGVIKPDVVFFGENVPGERVAEAWQLFAEAEVLLVAGSTLSVFSGRRFIYRARDQGVPIAIVNLGATRADELAALRVEERLGAVLPRLAEQLCAARR